jgi:pimeloyl-ACP methyl ester carboxylesterase
MRPIVSISLISIAFAIALSGCYAPVGVNQVTTRQAYEQIAVNALGAGEPSAETISILHRYGLTTLAASQPEEAIRQLHEKALASGERSLLFALSELSYSTGDRIRRSVKPWDARDARDYYLGSATYAWLFLFGEGRDAPPDAFDRRFRQACEFYNYSLGLALLSERRGTNANVQLESGKRQLPVGEIELHLDTSHLHWPLENYQRILLGDRLRVRGLSVRNRTAGVGAPLVCAKPAESVSGIYLSTPAVALLRGPKSLAELSNGTQRCSLEVYSDRESNVTIGSATVPLEMDLTVCRAYNLNQSAVWRIGNLGFLNPSKTISNRLILNQHYEPDRIPVVFVHGTFSSPVTWAEMANTLSADPVLRKRYQIWSYVYGTGNPIVYSIADLRAALTSTVQQLDPQGTNALLHQMVVIGHSQGGLLTKCTAVDTEDKLWLTINTNRLEDLNVTEAQRDELRRLIFLKPLPFVSRVVFIATPHRGSYMSGGIVRRLGQKLVQLPANIVARGSDLLHVIGTSQQGRFLNNTVPTSLDGMSPDNPSLQALANIPVVPGVKAHSIIAFSGEGDYHGGGDGIVKYQSAHVDYVESEFIVHSPHTCLNEPATIEEVRRILFEHLQQVDKR